MKISAILLAGGEGKRFGEPKLERKLGEKKIYEHALETIEKSSLFDEIILVKDALSGKTRQESSYKGLLACNNPDYVLIHDAARPLVTIEILKRNVDAVIKYRAVNTTILTHDTINYVENGMVSTIPNRRKCHRGQTPQTFAYDLILEAHKRTKRVDAPDDCSLVLDLGHPIHVVRGSERNLKITTPIDLAFAKGLIYTPHN